MARDFESAKKYAGKVTVTDTGFMKVGPKVLAPPQQVLGKDLPRPKLGRLIYTEKR